MTTESVLILLATGITALATTVSAYVAWQTWRGRLTVDWSYTWSTREERRILEVRLTAHNETSSIIDLRTVEASGIPIADVRTSREKHESRAADKAPLMIQAPPRKSVGVTVYVEPEWALLLNKARSRFARKSFRLKTKLVVASRSGRGRPRSISNHIPLQREMIERMALG